MREKEEQLTLQTIPEKEEEKEDAMSGESAAAGVATDSGLSSLRAVWFLVLWYFFSGCTLFLNKYIMSYLDGDSSLLASCQMLMTMVCGYVQMRYTCRLTRRAARTSMPPGFYRHMLVVGGMRFTTVLLGLVALQYVAVSFTETVKSSAPAFTVIISKILLDQVTGIYVKLSLIPVMGGLALCSANELSFNLAGFTASLATNISECCQNVYSKMLISGEGLKYSPAELQYFTSLASLLVTFPLSLFIADWDKVLSTDSTMLFYLLLNGFFFHCQTISAYYLMDFISPVTHSVANTGKRAFLIWASVLLFGNEVTFLSGLGTVIVILGVFLYNAAQEVDARISGGASRKLLVEKI